MKLKNKMIVICLIFFMLISISAVSAQNNNSDIITTNNNDNDTISINNLNNEILTANPGSFADLNATINGGSQSIELDRDYAYSSSDTIKDGIVINTDNLTIDGKGHTIDAKGQSRIFYVNSTTVYLKNIKFINGNAANAGAVYGYGENLRVINCTFINNTASGWGGAIYSYPDSLAVFVNSTFINNNAKYGGAILTVYGYRQYVINCTFESNQATDYGGAVGVYGTQPYTERPYGDRVDIVGSTFINNKAEYGDAISDIHSATLNITNCIILGNTSNLIDAEVYFVYADYNWFGNTYDNRSVSPKITKYVKVNNWLYLDIVPDLGTSSMAVSINNLYDNSTGKTSTYSTSKLPSIAVDVDADNSTMGSDKVILDNTGSAKVNFTFLDDTLFTASYQSSTISKKVKGGSFTDLQRIINAANDGDIITLEKDYVYIEGMDMMTQGIQIVDKHNLVIDGNGHTVNADGKTRVFAADKDSSDITFKNINIANGYLYSDDSGAGLHISSYNSKLINCTFINNAANTLSAGGAVYVHSSQFTIDGCRFINNTQLYTTAGALYLRGDGLTVKNTLFENNTANGFAGALESNDDCDIINCTFRNNSADYAGATFNYGHANIVDCTFIGNRATAVGDDSVSGSAGAVYAMNTTITNCVFTYNEGKLGAAIFIVTPAAVVDKCIFINNTATSPNGIICSAAKGGKVSNSIFLNNAAGYVGANVISCIYDGIVVDYNWFGNVWYNNKWNKYDTVPPVSNLAVLNNWLFLNATDFVFNGEESSFKTAFTFMEYDVATENIVEYGWDDLPEIDLKLSSQNLTLNKNVAKVGESVEGTSTYYKGTLYAEYENVKYQVPFKYQIPTSIDIGSVINVPIDSSKNVYFNITPFEQDYIPFLINSKRVTVTCNDTSVVNVVAKSYNIKLEPKKIGLALLTIKFNGINVIGEDKYVPSNTTVLINVTRVPTHIRLVNNITDCEVGDSGSIIAILNDYKNKSAIGSLEYKNNNESVIKLATNSFRALSQGLANVTISFAGNDKYEPCSYDLLFYVGIKESKISLPSQIIDDGNRVSLNVSQNTMIGQTSNIVSHVGNPNLTFISNDTDVASFTTDGGGNIYITANGAGVANLTIRFEGNERYRPSSASIIVTVGSVKTHIKVDTEINLYKTDTYPLNPYLVGEDGHIEGTTFEFVSSDPNVVTVDEFHTLNATGEGVATVTIYAKAHGKYEAANATVVVNVTIPKNSIIVNPEINLHVGENCRINATLETRRFNDNSYDLGYIINDTSIVTIPYNKTGYMYIHKEGVAEIIVVYEGNGYYPPCNKTVILTVTKGETRITAEEEISIHVGDSRKTDANLTSIWENRDMSGLIFNSSDESVVKVGQSSGIITAVGVGNATITVSYPGSDKYYSSSKEIPVTVDYVPTQIEVGKTISLMLEDTENIVAKLNPDVAGILNFKSNDDTIVKVDKNGVITAVGVGQTNVTVSFKGTKKYAPASENVLVTVIALDIPTSISVNSTFELNFNDSINIGAILNPSNAGKLTYASSNENIVKVDGNGVVTAVGVGEANVTVSFAGVEGKFLPSNATVLVKVNMISTEITAEDSISLVIDENKNISAVLSPAAGSLTYSSSNSSVVTVDGNGVLTGVGVGEAVVTVSYAGDKGYISSSKDITVTVNKISTEIDVGKTFALIVDETDSLNATLTPSGAGSLTYSSSDSSVVSVDSNGVITGVGVGQANITIIFKGSGKYASSNQTVLVSVAASIIPTSISVNNTIELDLHNSTTLGAVLTPSNAGNLIYVSSNENIVKVDGNGIVTAVGVGEANLTVSFAGVEGKFLPSNATVLVKVNKIGTEITAKDSISLFVDETENINALLKPTEAGDLTYTSSNESIVKVNEKGLITAVGVGEANVTVSYAGSDDYLSSSMNITVYVNRIPTQIDASKSFVVFVDGKVNVNASLTPDAAGSLIYETSDESIVKVDSNGIATGLGAGEAIITVRFNGTDKYAPASENISIIVKSIDIPTNISVNDKFELYVGDKIDLGAVLTPSNAGNLTYVSSDEGIIRVNENGVITAVGVGEANITIKFAGVKDKFIQSQATTNVKVSAIPTTITADGPITLNLTESSAVKYVFSNPEAGNVEFVIDNPSIITINNGVVTANNIGKTNITILFKGNENYTSSKATIMVSVVDVATQIDASDIAVNVTENTAINAKLTPDVGKLSYQSTNASVVTVDSNGVVTGVGVGEADILIKFEATGKYHESNKTIHVTVLDVATVIDASDVSVNITERDSIDAKLTPNVGKLSYESSDSSVVSVNSNGIVMGLKTGEANITIKFAGIGKYRPATKTITVKVVDVATSIDASDVVINVTERGSIGAKLTPNVGKLTYESSNSSIVTVDKYGAIKGIALGEADILIKFEATGKYHESSKIIHVKVVGVATQIDANDTISLFVDDEQNINAVLTPKTLGKLSYVSNDSSIVSVDADGKITAIKKGSATITISYEGEGKYLPSTKTVTVNVSRIPTKISMDEFDLELGEGHMLKPSFTPINNLNNLTYACNDSSVVEIDDSGYIMASACGKVLVTISYGGNEKYLPSNYTFELTITPRVTSIAVEKDIEIGFSESRDLGAYVASKYMELDFPLTYESSNPDIVSVDAKGRITGNDVGEATITIKFAGAKSFYPSNATVKVVVTTRTTHIDVLQEELSLYVDDDAYVGAYLRDGPKGAKLTYISSDISVVSVDSEGKIKANNAGNAVITAYYAGDEDYHSSSAKVNVTVSKLATKIVTDNNFEMKVFETLNLHAVLTPVEGILTYSSSDSETASVDATGKVTAKTVGNVVVTIKYAGDRKYLASQKQVIVVISKVPTSINVSDITIYSGEEFRLQNVVIPTGVPTSSRYLTFDSGDLEIFDVDDRGLITTYQEGITDLYIEFKGNDVYLPSNATVIVKVIKKTLSADDCTFNVEVSDDSGEATFTLNVPEDATGNFIVVVDGEPYGDEDNIVDGVAVVEVDELAPGDHKVTMRYTGDERYFSVNNQTTIHISRIKIDKNKDISVVYTESPVYTVHLTSDTQAMENKTVTFKVNGKTYYGTTDMYGYASVTLPKLPIKTYEITASYKGIKVTNKIISKHIVIAKNINAKKTKALKVQVTLNKVNKKYLAKKKVTLKFNGKKYIAQTNKKGVATFNIAKSALAKLKVGKSYTYKVTYSKDTVSKKIRIVK